MKAHSSRPRFSVVSAGRDAGPFIGGYTAAIESQGVAADDLEVFVIDTGSSDGTLSQLREWARRAPFPVSIMSRPGMTLGAARNLGLRRASGEWLTFPGLRDRWDEGFLAAIDRFDAAYPGLQLLSARPKRVADSRGVRGRGPRAWQYKRRWPVVNLDDQPNVFPFAPGSFVRRALVRGRQLSFDEMLRPFFEDGHFIARYLLGLDHPSIGLVRAARYLQQWTSSIDPSAGDRYADPDTYTTVLERGYLDLLERARAPDGIIKPWVQHLVIYELAQEFFREAAAFSTRFAPPRAIDDRFHELVREVAERLDAEEVFAHTANRLEPTWAEVLVHAYRDDQWVADEAELTDVDAEMGLQRVTYRYRGAAPSEAIEVEGRPVEAAYAKRRAISHLGRPELVERILWLPDGEVRLRLDGAAVPIRRPAPRGRRARRPGWIARRLLARPALRRFARKAFYRAAAILYRPLFRNAWVLIDRVHDAGDNGQRLFQYLRRERGDINAWFVLERGSPEWERLARRHPRRLVAYGSFRWRVLMLNAAWLLSSHTDASTIVDPIGLRGLVRKPGWKYAFLQHGVVYRDLSRWFNQRHIDLLVTSTPGEHASIAGDDTPYALTDKEVRLTELPRFDRLRALADAVPVDKRNLVIIAPTWRTWLTVPSLPGKQRRPIHDAFWSSEYLERWLAVLRDPDIAAAVKARGWRLAFMPHPNFQAALSGIDLPTTVERLTFARHDAQRVYARCVLMVTDYSSVAFDAAYIDRPVVYYQFDREDLETRHHGRSGYFDFGRDGFGPVALDHGELVDAVIAAIRLGPAPAPEYQRRSRVTFPFRDGGACARLVAAVEELSRPWRPPVHERAVAGPTGAQPGDDGPHATRSRDGPAEVTR